MLDRRVERVVMFVTSIEAIVRRVPTSRCGLGLINFCRNQAAGKSTFFPLPKLLGLPVAMFGKGCASTIHVSSIITLSSIRSHVHLLRDQKRLP
jgi:hypothetical protein